MRRDARQRSCAHSSPQSPPRRRRSRAAQEREHRIPIVRRPVGELEGERCRQQGGAAGAAQLAGRHPIAPLNRSLNRRTLAKPAASATSVTGSVVSVSSRFASNSRCVCAYSIGETPNSASKSGADAGSSRRRARQGARCRPRRARRPRSNRRRLARAARSHRRAHCPERARDGSAGTADSRGPLPRRRSRRNGSSRGAARAPCRRGGSRCASTRRRRRSGRRSACRASRAPDSRRPDRAADRVACDYASRPSRRLAIFGRRNGARRRRNFRIMAAPRAGLSALS